MSIDQERYNQLLDKVIEMHNNGSSWGDLCHLVKQELGIVLNVDALRKRAKYRCKQTNQDFQPLKCNHKPKANRFFTATSTAPTECYMQYNIDGSVESSRVIESADELIKTPNDLLNFLGYDVNEWEVISFRVSKWEGGKDGKERTAVKYKIRPRTEPTTVDYLKAAKEAFKSGIKPYHFTSHSSLKGLDDNKLMEIAPVELHFGKISQDIETGENYTYQIAQERFYHIFDEIYLKQKVERCGRCILVIGNDFFNSENDGCTSVNRIPQQNDIRSTKMFVEGLKMYTSAILSLREMFNRVDVMLCAGNHAKDMETFFFIALAQRFHDDNVIHFIENYRLTQVYQFGKCAIFYNHGDANLKQLTKSIPAEFAEVWGTHPYRELHLGHLHKEVTVDDEGGMITRRIGSPCSTDAWHYYNRYIGATKKHQIFIWDAQNGLKALHYIPIVNN